MRKTIAVLLIILVLVIVLRYVFPVEISGLVVARSSGQVTVLKDSGREETFISTKEVPSGRCSIVVVGVGPLRIVIKVNPVASGNGKAS